MTLLELARYLGWDERVSKRRKLRRLIRRAERAHSLRIGDTVTLLHGAPDENFDDDATGKRAIRSPQWVTLGELRKFMPELFDTETEIIERVRGEVEHLTKGIAYNDARFEEVESILKSLGERLSRVEKSLASRPA